MDDSLLLFGQMILPFCRFTCTVMEKEEPKVDYGNENEGEIYECFLTQ